MERVIRDIIKVGRLLFEEGLVGGRSGNLSVALGDKLLITRTGSFLGSLTPYDIIEVPLWDESLLDERASVELPVHRRIITVTGKRAVVHAHPPYTVSLSLFEKFIEPVDSEGKEVLGAVPVLELERPSASEELAKALSEALKEFKVVVVKGHGVFSADADIFRAYAYVSTLEQSSKIRVISKI